MSKQWMEERYDDLATAVLDWYLSGADFTDDTQLLFDKLLFVRERLHGREAA